MQTLAPKQVLHRARRLLTSTTGKSTPDRGAPHTAMLDASLDVCTKSLPVDDKNGRLGGFLRAKAKSLSRSKSPSRRNRKDTPGPESRSLVPSSTSATTSSSSQNELPAAIGSTQCMSSMADVDVPRLLREGVQMTKVSLGKHKTYKFQLDPDQGQIIWQSKKLRISTWLELFPVVMLTSGIFCSPRREYQGTALFV